LTNEEFNIDPSFFEMLDQRMKE
jgi:hypothetical protein